MWGSEYFHYLELKIILISNKKMILKTISHQEENLTLFFKTVISMRQSIREQHRLRWNLTEK